MLEGPGSKSLPLTKSVILGLSVLRLKMRLRVSWGGWEYKVNGTTSGLLIISTCR